MPIAPQTRIGRSHGNITSRSRPFTGTDAHYPTSCRNDGNSEGKLKACRDSSSDRQSDNGDGWKVAPIPAEVFNVNSHDCAWVNAQCTPQSLACFEEPIRLRGGLARIQDVTHILATGWGHSPLTDERAKMKGWRTHTIACGHDVMLDLPNELTDLLLEYASS
jgi:hypothetical protein